MATRRIAKRAFPLGDEAIGATAEASKALARLAGTASQLVSLDALARSVLRSESAASSRIEGLVISHKRLARATYAGDRGRGGDRRAAEVIGNVEAMERAIALGAAAGPFEVSDILDIHRTLLRHTDDQNIAGVIREGQNWIGGNDYNPVGADYVPPPPEHVQGLLEDLCRFVERDDLAAITQAAIAHAQFENIHPFADGNGRTGRALIYTVLRRRGEIGSFIPPVSLVLATEPKAYVGGLGAYSQGRVGVWCERFAAATVRAAGEAEQLATAVEDLQGRWLERLGKPRSDAAVHDIVRELPAHPVIDVAAGRRLTGKSHVAVGNAIKQLVAAGVLVPLNEKKWGRVWECDELLELVTDLERSVSTRY
jgi:Fic family protein